MSSAVKVTAPRGMRAALSNAKHRRRKLFPYLLLAPAIVMELLVHIVPMLVGVTISFLKLSQLYLTHWWQAPFAGFDNYRLALDFDLPAGKALLHSFGVTLAYTALVLVFSWLFGTAAAILTQRAFRGRGIVRTVFLVPFALPIFASVITWNFMAQRDTGIVNHVLVDQLHLVGHRPFWLIGGNSFFTLAIVTIWRSWPFAFLIVTAGLQSIPVELYEAAVLDGAGFAAQVRRVTLPLLAPVNRVLVLVLFLWTFNDFTTPYTLFGDTPPPQGDLVSIHIYQASFSTWNFGSGSAMSVLLLLFLLAMTTVYLAVVNRRTDHA